YLVAAEAARVHMAPGAHGDLCGLLGRDRGGAALLDPTPGAQRERRAGPPPDGRLPVARVLPRGEDGTRAARGTAARDPLEWLAGDAGRGCRRERARRDARPRHLGRPREDLQALAARLRARSR